MRPGAFQFGEDIFIADRYSLRIDVGVAALNMEPGDHFLDVFRHEQSVGLSRRLIRK
ncbi:hypothetical protein D3C75_1386750 [compost metagenome]